MTTDRAALIAHMDFFLDALVNHTPDRAGLAANVRYTENGQALPIGEGAWATVSALGGYRHDFADVETGNIVSIATIVEGGTHSILVTRLAVRHGAISEIECMAARPDPMTGEGLFAQGPAKLDETGAADTRWLDPIPQAERMTRADLRSVANQYFSGLQKNDGRGDYPFADECIRIENGFRTTGEGIPSIDDTTTDGAHDADTPYRLDFKAMTAKQQFETGYFAFVDRIRDRRFPVIDTERGVVFAFAFFDHSGTVRDYTLANGHPVTSRIDRPFSWQIAEAFRIEKGLFTRIEAVMTGCPYGMPPGWPMQEGDIA